MQEQDEVSFFQELLGTGVATDIRLFQASYDPILAEQQKEAIVDYQLEPTTFSKVLMPKDVGQHILETLPLSHMQSPYSMKKASPVMINWKDLASYDDDDDLLCLSD